MWTKKEKEKLQELFECAIGSDNTDYILDKLSEIYTMIWNTQIAKMCAIDLNTMKIYHMDDNEKNWTLVAKEKESD